MKKVLRFHRKLYLGKVPKTPRGGGGVHKMGGGQMVFPKNGGSVDEFDDFWGECSSNVIILGGVEIKLVDFGGSVVPFDKNLGGGKKILL